MLATEPDRPIHPHPDVRRSLPTLDVETIESWDEHYRNYGPKNLRLELKLVVPGRK